LWGRGTGEEGDGGGGVRGRSEQWCSAVVSNGGVQWWGRCRAAEGQAVAAIVELGFGGLGEGVMGGDAVG
jgi:hypothetical protein